MKKIVLTLTINSDLPIDELRKKEKLTLIHTELPPEWSPVQLGEISTELEILKVSAKMGEVK